MIKFEKLQLKNFLSYGNKPTVWEFHPGEITRISGENGSGKSACVTDALYYALFGKTYRKQKLEQLVNWINKKDMEVQLWFSVESKKYHIIRALKPYNLQVYIFNKTLQDWELIPVSSSSRDYQKIIEEDILQTNESTFNQTTIKSMTKNLSFLNLSKLEKRQVIDSILGIEVFSVMTENNKQNISANNNSIDIILERISNNNVAISSEQLNIDKLRKIQNQIVLNSKEELDSLNEEITEYETELKKHKLALTKLTKYENKKNKMVEAKRVISNNIKSKNKEIKTIETELIFLNKKVEMFVKECPECPKVKTMRSSIDNSELDVSVNLLLKEVSELQSEKDDLDVDLNKVNNILTNKTFINNTIKNNNRAIERINNKINKLNTSPIVNTVDESVLKTLIKNKKQFEKEYNNFSKIKKHLLVLKTLLSDDGIKTFIIKRYLPHINKILNTYLQKFNTNILFYFDTEFNDVIGSRYKENSNYNCFSEGQKRRIDLSVLFTFIEFSQIKNRKSNTNILVLDEITNGVDLFGENILYDILKEISKRENKEIITISHSGNIDPEKINNTYEVTTEQGFSKLTKLEL